MRMLSVLKSGQTRNQTTANRKTASLASQNSFPSSLIGVFCALSIYSIYLDIGFNVTVKFGKCINPKRYLAVEAKGFG